MGFEPTTSSMPSRRAPNCATAPPEELTKFIIARAKESRRASPATAPPEELTKFIIARAKESRRASPRMTTSATGALRSGLARVRPFARLHH